MKTKKRINEYAKPVLVAHGTLKELTMKIGTNADGGSTNKKGSIS